MLSIAFFPTDPRCHGNEIWDKIGYNLACATNITKILASDGDAGSEFGNWMTSVEVYHSQP